MSLTRVFPPLRGVDRELAGGGGLAPPTPPTEEARSRTRGRGGQKAPHIAGNHRHSVRAPYRLPRSQGITFDFKPIVLSTVMPVVHPPNNAARERLWIARFGSRFVAADGGGEVAPNRRIFARIENVEERMRKWAPYFLMMMGEALRDFRRGVSGGKLPLGQ